MTDWPGSGGDTGRYPSYAEDYEFIPEMYSARVIKATRENLVCANLVDLTFRDQLRKGDVLKIPVGSSLVAGDVDPSEDYGGNMNTTWGTNDVTITIDEWKECPVQIDDATAMQSHIDLLAKMADRAGFEIAKAIDTNVNSKFSGLTATNIGSDGQTFTDDIMIALMEQLDEADVPRIGRSLVIDPSTIADIYKIDKFVHSDYINKGAVATGNIGQMYGVPVYVTNNLTEYDVGSYGVLLHKEAIGLVLQSQPKIEKGRWMQRHSDVVNVTAIWGCDVLRPTFGAPFYTRIHKA